MSCVISRQRVIVARKTTTLNGVFQNSVEGRLVVQGINNYNATLTVSNGNDFKNYGTIELTNMVSSFHATLSVTNGTLTNHGTIKSYQKGN